MDELGWDSCDIILVTGDAYIDHPSFGMALVGRLLESHGFRVGILDQPAWRDADAFRALGRPNLMWGVTGGNMDSMVNRYTSDRKVRSDDAYSPEGAAGFRPDRAVIVYAQRCREAFPDVPLVIGGIEASLRRIAHYDYWSDEVRRSLLDRYTRRLARLRQRRARDRRGRTSPRRRDADHRDPRPARHGVRAAQSRRCVISSRSTRRRSMRRVASIRSRIPTRWKRSARARRARRERVRRRRSCSSRRKSIARARSIRMPSYDQVVADPVLYAHASRILHLESNPGNARTLVQRHGKHDVWINPPPLPLTTQEMDALYELPFARVPHPRHATAKIPAYEMIRFSVTILRGCFGGCSFCSITEHEGRIIQSRSEASILREVERIRDRRRASPATSAISAVRRRTCIGWRARAARSRAACRKPSCVYPDICDNLGTDHAPLVAAVSQGARDQGRQADLHRVGRPLRPRGAIAGVDQGARAASHRRLLEDRARAHRDRPARAHDEAGHRRVRSLQGAVRPLLDGGGQGAVPDPVLHRRASRARPTRTC